MRISTKDTAARLLVLTAFPLLSMTADVTDSSATGFTSVNKVVVDASADRAYDTAITHIGSWWDPEHTWSGDARNLTIDARAGGIFREALPDGGSVTHMAIVYADPARSLRFQGGLGPLQGMAITGSLTWQYTTTGNRTEIRWTYAVSGYAPGGVAPLSGPVDSVLRHQLERLKRFIETGAP